MPDELVDLTTDAQASRFERAVLDLALFLGLNEEYKTKPVISRPSRFDEESPFEYARRRDALSDGRVALRGRRELEAGRDLLTGDAIFHPRANFYRSAVASHLYRDVYFPWAHLLFTDSVFEEFHRHIGQGAQRPFWANKLTYAEYHRYFDLLRIALRSHRSGKAR